jgi:tetratricopeptide (TPR) repeat protein
MSPERYQRACEIFDAAVERSAGVEEFVRAECGGDEELYSEVCRMIEAHRRTGILDRQPTEVAAARAGSRPVFSEGQMVAGRYRIVRYLSRGGMGEVYEAEDLDLPEMKEHVALKTLLPAIASDDGMVARFKQEIALSRKIQHPNVCGAFDLSRHEVEGSSPILFLTMPFLPGETLAARLDEGRMTPEQALPLLEQMAEALDAAHRAGVIHRDFKPSNVMLVPAAEGTRAVVTDFGLARRVPTGGDTTSTLSATVAGTLDYMAPELLTGSIATFGSDVYALGMVAYKMVTGALPFAAEAPLAGAILRAKQPAPSPKTSVPDLDPKWERAILRAVDANPAIRFSRAHHFLQSLRGAPVSVTVRFPVITRRRAVAAGLAALVLAGAVVAWRAWENERSRPPAEAAALYHTGVDDIHAGAYFAATKALSEAVKIAPRYALAHARLADAWFELEMYETATEEALLARRTDISGLSQAGRVQIEAIDLETTREFGPAAAKYEQMTRAAGGKSADVSIDLGRAYEKANKPDKAIESYQRAADGPSHSPAAWLRLGVLFARQANKAKSDEAFAQAERLYQMTSNLEGLTETALQRGIAANTRGQLDIGAAYLKKSLENARLAGNLQQEITAMLRLSTNAYMSGDAAAAERYARDALETARRHQLGEMATRALVSLGNVSVRNRDFPKAEQYYRDALDLARQNRSGHLKAVSLASLASLHGQTQHREESAREAQEALAFYQPNGYAKESLQCLTLIARAKRDSGDYDGALSTFRSLLETAERAQDRLQIALAHENIGTLLFNQDHYPEALQEYQKNLESAPDSEHIGYAALQCGNTLWRLGRYPEAESMFKRADAIAERFAPLRLELMSSRASMLLSQNRYIESASAARRAMDADPARAPGMQSTLRETLGSALLGAGSKQEGLKSCEESLVVIEGLANVDDILRARVAVLQARIENGDLKGALLAFHEAEPGLASHSELLWRALAFASRADPQYFSQAREALQALSHQWGDAVYNVYLTRPDIQKLYRPLLQSISAKQ